MSMQTSSNSLGRGDCDVAWLLNVTSFSELSVNILNVYRSAIDKDKDQEAQKR